MKVFASKQRESLSLIPRLGRRNRASLELNASALRDSYRGWLYSVTSGVEERKTPAVYRIPRLTAVDVSRVNQATIREGESHCIWPPSVIRRFNRAQVITESAAKHYVLDDVNITRVESKARRAKG